MLCLLLLLAVEAAPAAAPAQLTPPRLLQPSAPVYPAEAAAQGLDADVLLTVDIAADGHVANAAVKAPAGHGFDEAALAAAQGLVFEPATMGGKPIAVRIEYRYRFHLAVVKKPAPAGELVTLRGLVLERGTRDPIRGAQIEIDGAPATATDAEGAFTLDLRPGKHALSLEAAGFAGLATDETLVAGKRLEATYRLSRGLASDFEATVVGKRERTGDVVRRELVLEEITKVPGTQGDALKVLQDMPGVARTPFGIGALVVRGAAPAGTKVFLDGIELPVLFHFAALSAVVNADLLSGMDFYPGTFSARFGRADAGIVELRTRPGKERLHGYVDIDLLNSVVLGEGPLPGGGTFLASIRRSYVDVVLNAALAIGSRTSRSIAELDTSLQLAPRYYDYQVKADWTFGRDHLWVMGFGDDDGLDFLQAPRPGSERDSFSLHTAFHRASGGWTRALGNGAENRLVGAVGIDRNILDAGSFISERTRRTLFQLRDELRVPTLLPRLSLAAGVDALIAQSAFDVTQPGVQQPGQPPPADIVSHVGGEWSVEPALWAELAWTPIDALRIVPGVRGEVSYPLGRTQWIDPRIAAYLTLTPDTTLTASAGQYHRRPTPDQLLPKVGNPDLLPERSIQTSAGVEQALPWALTLDATLYYNWLSDIPVRRSSAGQIFGGGTDVGFSLPGGIPSDNGTGLLPVESVGQGHAYGLEVLLKRRFADRIFGWVAYTLSRSTRLEPGIPGWHFFSLDQTHILTALASVKTGRGWRVGARARLVSGDPFTPVVGAVFNNDVVGRNGSRARYQPVYGPALSGRLPAFFALDLRVDKEWTFETWRLSLFVDVTNVSNRQNPVTQQYSFDYKTSIYFNDLPIFPSFGLKGEL